MGLLLFWGVEGEPAVIIITDGGVKPHMFLVEKTDAVADVTTTTYNDETVTFSSATQTYGGADRAQSAWPSLIIKPDMVSLSLLSETIAQADETTTVYNDANTLYSSSTQTYGGSDRIVDRGPQIIQVGS
jgi:hypothetical protein